MNDRLHAFLRSRRTWVAAALIAGVLLALQVFSPWDRGARMREPAVVVTEELDRRAAEAGIGAGDLAGQVREVLAEQGIRVAEEGEEGNVHVDVRLLMVPIYDVGWAFSAVITVSEPATLWSTGDDAQVKVVTNTLLLTTEREGARTYLVERVGGAVLPTLRGSPALLRALDRAE